MARGDVARREIGTEGWYIKQLPSPRASSMPSLLRYIHTEVHEDRLECTHVADTTFLFRHFFPSADVATTASEGSLPNTSSTLLSSVVPQIFHPSSFPPNIFLCRTTYSTTSFSLVVSLARRFAGDLSRPCIDLILTTTWYSADFSVSSGTILVLTIRAEPIYLCSVHCSLSLGGRTLIRARNEAKSPS